MKNIIIIITCVLLFSNATQAQTDNWNWCFQDFNGITFNTNDTTPELFDGCRLEFDDYNHLTASSHFVTQSDKEGNLLLYTGGGRYDDGGKFYRNPIWNKYHRMVKNSSEANTIRGIYDQIILPYPGKKNLFYLIKRIHHDTSSYTKILFDLIDINTNDGEGEVISKNNVIYDGLDLSTFDINIIKHSNRLSYWIICRGMKYQVNDNKRAGYISEIYRCYHLSGNKVIDSSEFSVSAVLIRYSYTHPSGKYIFTFQGIEGETIKTPWGEYRSYGPMIAHIFSFNTSSGRIQPFKSFTAMDSGGFWSIEFAKKSNKFYIIEEKREWPFEFFWKLTYKIHQYTFSNDANAMEKSKKLVSPVISDLVFKGTGPKPPDPDGSPGLYAKLKIGPDNKIYILRGDKFSCLSNIDEDADSVNFIEDAIILNNTGFYLPIHIYDNYNVHLELLTNTPVCQGEPINLRATLSDTLYESSWQWSGPDDFESEEQNPIIQNASLEHSGWYVLKATVNGAELFDSVYVEVQELSKPEIAGEDKAFLNQTKLYKTPNPKKAINQWSAEGGSINGSDRADSVYVMWTNIGTGKLILEQFFSEFECDGYNELGVNVTDWGKLTIQGDDAVCLNDTSYYSTSANKDISYDWSVENGVMFASETNSMRVFWPQLGTGTIELITYNQLTQQSDTIEKLIIINDNPPKPDINHEGNYLVTKEYSSHEWYLNGDRIIGESRNFIKAKENGKYRVIVKDSNGCRSDLSEEFDLILSVAEQSETAFYITPNPATDYIEINNVMLMNELTKNPFLSVKVFDVLGIEVLNTGMSFPRKWESPESSDKIPDQVENDTQSIRLDISALAPGVYFVKVGGQVSKFVKM